MNVPPHLGVLSVTVLRDSEKSSSSADKQTRALETEVPMSGHQINGQHLCHTACLQVEAHDILGQSHTSIQSAQLKICHCTQRTVVYLNSGTESQIFQTLIVGHLRMKPAQTAIQEIELEDMYLKLGSFEPKSVNACVHYSCEVQWQVIICSIFEYVNASELIEVHLVNYQNC